MSKRMAIVACMVMLVSALALSMTGCGGGGGSAAPTPTPTPSGSDNPGVTAPPATVSSPDGEVLVQRKGTEDWIEAAPGMKLEAGDRLRTGDDGTALLVFFEGSVMEVEAGTEVLVGELSAAADGGSTIVKLQQLVGNTVNRVQEMVDSASRYEVETPAGTAVVRGTVFKTEVDEEGHTWVYCEDGSVWFTAGGVTVLLEQGMHSEAGPSETPSGPSTEATPVPSPTPGPSVPFSVANIQVCSSVDGRRSYTIQEDAAFGFGQKVWIYFEVFGFSWQTEGGKYEVWCRVSDALVRNPEGEVYLSGTDLVDMHDTNQDEVSDYLWGTLSFSVTYGEPAGQYSVEAHVEDVFSGATEPFTVEFTVDGSAAK